tara:strand:- start:1461 stop:2264 length:804 start_codon:yes stop_codon:yes gene_type:complete
MALTGKPLNETYLDILQVGNTNNGVDGTLRTVKDGSDSPSALSISDDEVLVQQSNVTGSTTAFQVKNKVGTTVLSVDSSANMTVKAGQGQHNVLSQFTTFGMRDISPTAGTWYPLYNQPSLTDSSSYAISFGILNLGAGTYPDDALALDSTNEAQLFLPSYFVAPHKIVIEGFTYLIAADDASTVNIVSRIYDLEAGTGSTQGDLSNGSVSLYALGVSVSDSNRIVYGTGAVATTNMNAGQAMIVCVENTAATHDLTVQVRMQWRMY